jgi:hypothetical protein
MFAQTDRRTRETKIADIVMQLPASNTASFNRLMDELSRLGGVVTDLAPQLADPGGNDAQIRYAIGGLAMYASKNADMKAPVAKSLCEAIPRAKSDEIRDFLFIQLQYVAGRESMETVFQYLDHARLADAAVRVLIRILGDEFAAVFELQGRTKMTVTAKSEVNVDFVDGKQVNKYLTADIQAALGKVTGAPQLSLVEALGDMRYWPAEKEIRALAATGDAKLRKVAWHSLAQIADPTAEKILAGAAEKAGYAYEPADAFGSYVLFLRNSLSQAEMVSKAARKMLKAVSETSQIAAKCAALELLTLSAGEKAIGDVTGALKSDSRQYRQAALKYSANIKSGKMYDALMQAVKKEKRAEAKAEIIASFGERGDKAAWPFVRECLADGNGSIRAAAIVSAGKLAGADAVAPIAKAMNTGDTQVVTVGKNTLLGISGDQVTTEAAAAIPQTSAQAKTAFMEILAARGAVSQAGSIFAQTSSTDAGVRLAADKALKSVVTGKDVPRIAQLLNDASDKDEIAALQQALFVAVSSESREAQPDIIAKEAINSRSRIAYAKAASLYCNVLAMIGGEKALDMVMTNGFNSSDAGAQEAAFEALINWSDNSATPQLYKIAAGDPSGPYFDAALSAYVAKAGASKSTPEQKLLMLRNALAIAGTPAQKQAILRQIARTGTFVGLITAGKYLDDHNSDVQQAAVQAVRTIALAHAEYCGPEPTALLNKAMAVNRDPEADYQKQAILKHMDALPKDGGFVSMFNGKDLAGWKGLVENPVARAKMTPKQLAEKQVKADEIMRRDWKVDNGLLVFEGKGYDNLCSVKDYGDFELYVDWRITAKGDAGIYLRGTPQVQIWDIALTNVGAQVGSGGLYNNQKHMSKPLVVADNPVNEWNSFYIKMIGEKVTVYLNGQLVVDNVTLENFWDRKLPIFGKDAIELQAHGERVEYRDIYVREIPRPEPYQVSDAEKAEGFVPMFNGIDMSGWIGNLRDYVPRDGAIVCDPSHGGRGNLYTDREYADFIMRFEFQLTPAANNGLGIRTPLEGDAAYAGMELQILDNEADVYRNLQIYQYHGSVYGVIPAKRGYLKPVGEWNSQEVIAEGSHIKITLNGTVILDGDIAQASKNFTETADHLSHPGLSNKSGHIGFLGHGSELAFRNMRIKDLSKPEPVKGTGKGKK